MIVEKEYKCSNCFAKIQFGDPDAKVGDCGELYCRHCSPLSDIDWDEQEQYEVVPDENNGFLIINIGNFHYGNRNYVILEAIPENLKTCEELSEKYDSQPEFKNGLLGVEECDNKDKFVASVLEKLCVKPDLFKTMRINKIKTEIYRKKELYNIDFYFYLKRVFDYVLVQLGCVDEFEFQFVKSEKCADGTIIIKCCEKYAVLSDCDLR